MTQHGRGRVGTCSLMATLLLQTEEMGCQVLNKRVSETEVVSVNYYLFEISFE